MDKILSNSRVAAKLVSRTVDLTFLSLSFTMTVALSGFSSWLFLTLCRCLIPHINTCTPRFPIAFFPREPRVGPIDSGGLALLDGTFSLGLSKMEFGGINSSTKRWITRMNIPSSVISSLDMIPATWRPP